jgi:biotin synthase
LKIVIAAAKDAKYRGAGRFCANPSGEQPSSEIEFDASCKMIGDVKSLGMETCATLGMVGEEQAIELK